MTTWAVLIARVVDGDTVRLFRTRDLGTVDGLRITATDTEPIACRLVHVDTPERGEHGWAQARDDLAAWCDRYRDWLAAVDAGRDNFGRHLIDLRAGDESATMHMVRDKGWSVWTPQRPVKARTAPTEDANTRDHPPMA